MKDQPVFDGRPGETLEPLDFDELENKLKVEYGKGQNKTLVIMVIMIMVMTGIEMIIIETCFKNNFTKNRF